MTSIIPLGRLAQRINSKFIHVPTIAHSCTSRPMHYQQSRQSSRHFGNPERRPANKNDGLPQRWKRVWFLTMKRKAELEGPDDVVPKSSQINWNYNAELAAFQVRLELKCSPELLTAAFSEPSPEEHEDKEVHDYRKLSSNGRKFTQEFISHYVNVAFPLLPAEAKLSIERFLLNTTNVAFIARNLGIEDLIQCIEFPPNDEVLENCFLAMVEVINTCEGPVAAGRFLLDFIVPQLAEKEIMEDLWIPPNPMALLVKELEARSQPLPEARLVRQSGINTALPVFFIALFSGEKFLCESGGESIPLAEMDAAKIALKKLYKIEVNSKVAPMGHRVDDKFLSQLFEPLLSKYTDTTKELENKDTVASSL